MTYPKFKVCVLCFTFNQAQYIADALKGFSMQQTNFPFVCCIVDDASTDGEQEVIRQYVINNFEVTESSSFAEYATDYAQITFAQHKTNKNCYFAVLYLKENHYSKRKSKLPYLSEWRDCCEFEAICEGDDYWIATNKLQSQVNWLDEHKDYSMVCSDGVVDKNGLELDWKRYNNDSDISVKEMVRGDGDFVLTASIVVRMNILNYPDFFQKCKVGDYPLQIWSVLNGKVRYLSDKMVVYRYMAASSWTLEYCNADICQKIQEQKNINEFLKNIDEYTSFKYHNIFEETIRYFIYKIFIFSVHSVDIKTIKSEFKDEYIKMSISQKIDIWLLQHELNRVFYRKQNFVRKLARLIYCSKLK